MDLIPEDKKESLFKKRKEQIIEKAGNFKIKTFATSIWEISLYIQIRKLHVLEKTYICGSVHP